MLNLSLTEPSFPHRHNANGTYDSICTRCFVTVATVRNEAELAGRESAHICDPVDLCRLDQGAYVSNGAKVAIPC
jgi:hypothetical protein